MWCNISCWALVPSFLVLAALPGQALPTGGSVVSGEAQITPTNDTRVDIYQASDRAILHWDQFNLGAGHQIFFHHPTAAAATLNRVLGSTPSTIAGEIHALGTVLIVNPNGILFTDTALVDVGGLLATSLTMPEADFTAGTPLVLTAGHSPSNTSPGPVINQGQITVAEGGYAALVAPQVANRGVIQARLGRIDLAAGSRATVDLYGDGLLSLAIDPALVGSHPEIAGLIDHSGTLSADGGQVGLSAGAGAAVVNQVINTTGIIEAQRVEQQGGRIILAGADGTIALGGTLTAPEGTVAIEASTLTVTGEIGASPGQGTETTAAVTATLGTSAEPGRLEILETGFLRVRELALASPGGTVAIANRRPDGLHGTVLHLNTGLTVETYGFNPSTVVNVALGASIQAGINAATDGGTVNLAPGIHTEGATVDLVNRTLTLRGAGADATTVSGANTYQVFNVADNSTVTFDGLTVQGGQQVPGSGGGLFVGTGSTVTIANSAVVDNLANGLGGGIYVGVGSTLTLVNSTLSGNRAENAANNGAGGALLNDGGTVTILNSTLSGNQANFAGAIRNQRDVGTLTLINSTVTNNQATHPTSGIASGGIRVANGTVTIANSIVAGNRANNGPNEVTGPVISGGHNLVGTNGNAGGFAVAPTDIVLPGAIDTAIGPLQNNGGPTQTHALVVGSPGIGAGDPTALPPGLTTDQRGFVRQGVGTAVDIGAYGFEVVPPAPTLAGNGLAADVTPLQQRQCRAADVLSEGVTIAALGERQWVALCTVTPFPAPRDPTPETPTPLPTEIPLPSDIPVGIPANSAN